MANDKAGVLEIQRRLLQDVYDAVTKEPRSEVLKRRVDRAEAWVKGLYFGLGLVTMAVVWLIANNFLTPHLPAKP